MSKRIEQLYKMADEAKIIIDEKCPEEIIAMSIKFPNGRKVISLSDLSVNPDNIYTKLECFAHEMGHCATDSFYEGYSPLERRAKHEYKADKWAINYLIPFEDLCQAVSSGYRELWQLAEYFNVSTVFIEKAIQMYEQHGQTVPKEFYCNE